MGGYSGEWEKYRAISWDDDPGVWRKGEKLHYGKVVDVCKTA